MENEKGGSPAPDSAAHGAGQESEGKGAVDDASSNSVKYESYLREKRRAQNWQSKSEELETKLAEFEQRALAAEGDKDKLIETLKKQNEELSTKNKAVVGSFAYKALTSQIVAEATKAGCIDTDALVQLMDVKGFEVDPETFNTDSDALKAALEEQKKARPYLFSKAGPKINNSLPTAGGVEKKKSIGEMTPEEQAALIKQIDKMEGKNLGW